MELQDVLVSLFVPDAGHVRVGQLIHQHERRLSLEHGIQVHFLKDLPAVVQLHPGDRLEDRSQLLRLLPLVALQVANDDIDPLGLFLPGFLQHGVRLAHPGGHAEKNLELSLALPLLFHGAQEDIGIRPLVIRHGRLRVRITESISPRPYFGNSLSRATLSASTFTRGSPRKPSCGPSSKLCTSARSREVFCAVEMPRGRHSLCLYLRRLRADLRVEPAAGGEQHVHGRVPGTVRLLPVALALVVRLLQIRARPAPVAGARSSSDHTSPRTAGDGSRRHSGNPGQGAPSRRLFRPGSPGSPGPSGGTAARRPLSSATDRSRQPQWSRTQRR